MNELINRIMNQTDWYEINDNCGTEEAAEKEIEELIANDPLKIIDYLLTSLEELED